MAQPEPLLLDTHIWFRLQVIPHTLKPAVVTTIEAAAVRNEVYVSVISIWELAMLERDGRIALTGGAQRWSEIALSKPGISMVPLSPAIAVDSVFLPASMHKNPADRILVATARIEQLTLVTADKAIRDFAKQTGLACLRA